MTTQEQLPPGQVWGKKFVVYAALSIPRVDPKNWKLRIDGMVKQPVEYSYDQLVSGGLIHYTRSFHCLLPNGFVYAEPQPMAIADVREGTKIIGADGLTHRVSHVIRRHHAGRIVGIKSTYLPAERMTPDHPIWIVPGHPGSGKTKSKRRKLTFAPGWKPRWRRADETKIGDYVFFPKYRFVSKREQVEFQGRVYRIDKKLADLTGWYVAEGSGASSDGRTIAFSLNSLETEHGARLKDLLEQMFNARVGTYTNSRGTLLKLVTTSSDAGQLHYMLREWCGTGAASKHIPEFIMNAEPSILRQFLVSYFYGDGYSKEAGEESQEDLIDFTTSSRILACQLLLALSKLEIPGNLVNHPGSVRMGYSVRVTGEKVKRLLPEFRTRERINRFHYMETEDGFYYPIKKVWSEKYEGDVYDFQAPPTYTMLSPFVTQDCVTSWSIKDVEWDGVQIRKLVEPAGVDPASKWAMFHCVDGYSAPVLVEDALHEDAIVAFRLNGKPLSAEQGFPARPFVPQLYAWKSAKWLNRIEFIRDYTDGYWEMYGYHERANVWEEERFKGHSGKHSKKTAYGTA